MHAKNNCQNSPDSGQSSIKNVFKQPNQITSYLNLGLKLQKWEYIFKLYAIWRCP